MVSHTFPGIAPLVISTKTFDARFDKFVNSEGYSVHATAAAIGVANDYILVQIRNPLANTKTLYVEKCTFTVDVATIWRVAAPVTPVSVSTGTAATPQPKKAGQAASVALVDYIDTAAAPAEPNLAGGRLVANQPLEVLLGIVLPPNSSVQMGAQMPATTQKYNFTPEWYEE